MKRACLLALAASQLMATLLGAEEVLFRDDFKGKLGAGWSWVREERAAWRVTAQALEVRILPGNLWGGANDAKNVLVRPAPDTAAGEVEISVTVEHQPTGQYEQAGIAWYYDDGHMIKLNKERVDGKPRIVMGREEADRTRTIAILDLDTAAVRLRLLVSGHRLRGQYRPAGTDTWRDAGACDLPAPLQGTAKIALQSYQGVAGAEHWARFTEFRVTRTGK